MARMTLFLLAALPLAGCSDATATGLFLLLLSTAFIGGLFVVAYLDLRAAGKEASTHPDYRILRHEVAGRVLYEPQWWNRRRTVTRAAEPCPCGCGQGAGETYSVSAPRWEPIVESRLDLPAELHAAEALVGRHRSAKAEEDYWGPRTEDGTLLRPRDSGEEVVAES